MGLAINSAVAVDLADVLAAAFGGNAVLEIRTGAYPGPDNAATGTLLVSVTLPGTFATGFNPTFCTNPGEVLPTAAGTAGHFRIKTSGGTAVLDGTVSGPGGGGDLELSSTSIVMGVPVDLGSPNFTVPLS